METTLEQQQRTEQGHQRRSNDRWAWPHDPEQNARPPGNGDLDRRIADESRERLLAVLGG
jgi:hypothetical protein